MYKFNVNDIKNAKDKDIILSLSGKRFVVNRNKKDSHEITLSRDTFNNHDYIFDEDKLDMESGGILLFVYNSTIFRYSVEDFKIENGIISISAY